MEIEAPCRYCKPDQQVLEKNIILIVFHSHLLHFNCEKKFNFSAMFPVNCLRWSFSHFDVFEGDFTPLKGWVVAA
jgi:hypothetical protein